MISLVRLSIFPIILFFSVCGNAQTCPPNIDFESGTFNNWTCYIGNTSAVGNENVINLNPSGGPISEKHTIYNSVTNAGELDQFGQFPVVCPNGSGYSIRLGSTTAGGEAEGVSYEFIIPQNQNDYSLTYHYAVVFQSPNHRENEQPRMEIEVTNVSDNAKIECSSFTFIAVGSSMPGFQTSGVSDSATVLFKDWSAVSVDLSGLAGKTIRLFFKTADCTFRRHFGYAYIDVNSECTNSFVGTSFCPGDTLVKVTAPYGYQTYEWFNGSLSQQLGTAQTLVLSPPPLTGTELAVKVTPYDGYGCPITLRTELKNNLVLSANAGKDVLSCNNNPVMIGSPPRADLNYQWSPAIGLNNPKTGNPFAAPDVTTNYILKVSSVGGGCSALDTVTVKASIIDSSLRLVGKDVFCIDNRDSAILMVQPTANIQWYKNDVTIGGATNSVFRVTSSGTYQARLKNADGCTLATNAKTIVIDKAKSPIAYPVKYAVVDLPLNLKARQIGENVLWNPLTNLNDVKSFTPVFQGANETLYTVEIRTATECVTVDTQLVKIVRNVEIYLPNAFTPNGDGRNDLLRPHLRGILQLRHFKIFNRWGQLMFDTQSEETGWNGNYKGTPQPTQTLVWILEGVGVDNVIYTKKGTATLIR